MNKYYEDIFDGLLEHKGIGSLYQKEVEESKDKYITCKNMEQILGKDLQENKRIKHLLW